MDPIVGAALSKSVDATGAEAAKVAGNLLTRLLGPSADIIGADWAERLRQRNLQRLLEKTQKRAADEEDPGHTQPRLAAATFEAAQYADDEIVTEYLSGVLASSRAPDGGDDAGLPWSAAVARLSTLQIRLHFLVYFNARALIAPQGARMFEAEKRVVVFPLEDVCAAMGIDGSERMWARFQDAVDGLVREGLLGASYQYGSRSFFEAQEAKARPYLAGQGKRRQINSPDDSFLRIAVTDHGVHLFLWGLGHGESDLDIYMDRSVPLGLVDPVPALGSIKRSALEEDIWEEIDAEPDPADVADSNSGHAEL